VTAEALRRAYRAAAERVLEQFPVSPGSLELVAVSENVTFRVAAADTADHYALRLHRPGYNSLGELESERCWMEALQRAGVQVQGGLRTRAGAHFCRVWIPQSSEERYAGLTRWMPGELLAERLAHSVEAALEARAYCQIGRLAAAIHRQSASWEPPGGFTRPRLDAEGLIGAAPRWGRFWEHPELTMEERALLLQARDTLASRLRAYGRSRGSFGLIHADLHPENIVIHDGTVGVIDFDDAAFGWFVYDLATALLECWGTPAYPALRDALVSGYREVRPLASRDEGMLETFLLLRGMSMLGWFAERPEHAHSTFFGAIRERVMDACRELLCGRSRSG
jgi:Ser/Thr protein kinase RdoA (MazF antagonist)